MTEFERKFEKLSAFTETLGNYAITVLLEIIRSECKEVPGFAYLAKKCYLAEKMRGLNVFGFSKDEKSVCSDFIQHTMQAIKGFELVRVVEVGDAISKDTRNYSGEMCREYISINSDQVEEMYLNTFAGDPDFKKWQKVIDKINRCPNGKDWHTLSIAVHLYSHRKMDVLRVISDTRREARGRNVLLPKSVFADATNLLTELNLFKTN